MKRFIKIAKSSKIYIFSLIFIAILVFVSLIAPLLPIDPAATDVANLSQSPSLQHLFGTDEVGRDYFIRVIYGGRISLIVGLLAMVTAVTIGTIVGLIAGYVGGVVDTLLMRLVDVLSSIPWLVLVIVLSVFLKPGIGPYITQATRALDYPIIMAVMLLSATLVIVGNLISDILYSIVDPRIRRGGK